MATLEATIPHEKDCDLRLHEKSSFDQVESQQEQSRPCDETKANVTALSIKYAATKPPKATLEAVYKAGEYKAGLPLDLLSIQCFMAGIYIAAAGHLFLVVEGGLLGAALFPTGLIAVILTTAELFTGDALVFVASVLGQRVSFVKLLRNWTVAWCMNFAGCLFWAGAMAYGSNALADSGVDQLAVRVALAKVEQPWIHIFLKGIGANLSLIHI